MEVPASLLYTKEHEWVRTEADGTLTVGITDFAQNSLGDVTFVDLPRVGAVFEAGKVFGVVESVKAASDLYLPVSGEILEVNPALASAPELVNRSPYGDAWMVRLRATNSAELSSLLTAAQYAAL